MPQVTLSSETVVGIAKDTLVPLQCEWKMSNGKPCTATLGSWNLLEKHLITHCKTKAYIGSNWLCKLPKCNMPVHNSLRKLQQHVLLSHVASVALPCPIACCDTSLLMRLNQLTSHFEEDHPKLDGKPITLPNCDILLPRWTPFSPKASARQLVAPNLPAAQLSPPGSCLTRIIKPRPVPFDEHVSLSQAVQQRTSKRQQRQLADKMEETDENLPSLTFGSLEKVDKSVTLVEEALFSVLHPSWSHRRDLSSSQGMHGSIPYQALSPTIHYKVLARRMEEEQ